MLKVSIPSLEVEAVQNDGNNYEFILAYCKKKSSLIRTVQVDLKDANLTFFVKDSHDSWGVNSVEIKLNEFFYISEDVRPCVQKVPSHLIGGVRNEEKRWLID